MTHSMAMTTASTASAAGDQAVSRIPYRRLTGDSTASKRENDEARKRTERRAAAAGSAARRPRGLAAVGPVSRTEIPAFWKEQHDGSAPQSVAKARLTA